MKREPDFEHTFQLDPRRTQLKHPHSLYLSVYVCTYLCVDACMCVSACHLQPRLP
jgi:hypothetical protein